MNNQIKTRLIVQDKIALDEKYDEAMDFITSGNVENGFAAGLVFEELFVNVMNYAYQEKGNGPIMIRIDEEKEETKIMLVDFGVPFNPVERANWIATAGQIGGRGIDLVKTYSKKFEYQKVFDSNVVRVIV